MSQDMVRHQLVISSVYELPLNLIVFHTPTHEAAQVIRNVTKTINEQQALEASYASLPLTHVAGGRWMTSCRFASHASPAVSGCKYKLQAVCAVCLAVKVVHRAFGSSAYYSTERL